LGAAGGGQYHSDSPSRAAMDDCNRVIVDNDDDDDGTVGMEKGANASTRAAANTDASHMIWRRQVRWLLGNRIILIGRAVGGRRAR